LANVRKVTKRISQLGQSCPKFAHEFRFLAGAVFALASAEKMGHKNRASYVDTDRPRLLVELNAVFNAIGCGKTPPKQWKAGFYYNAAIMRIAACYERLLKAVRASRALTLARTSPNGVHLQCVCDEVNKLKHDLFGQKVSFAQKRANQDDLSNAWVALTELLDLLENSYTLKHLSSNYRGLPKP
jgi:hypothetical protein